MKTEVNRVSMNEKRAFSQWAAADFKSFKFINNNKNVLNYKYPQSNEHNWWDLIFFCCFFFQIMKALIKCQQSAIMWIMEINGINSQTLHACLIIYIESISIEFYCLFNAHISIVSDKIQHK